MSAEQIYKLLIKDQAAQDQAAKSPQIGQVQQLDADPQTEAVRVDKITSGILTMDKGSGSVSGGLKERLRSLLFPPVNWRTATAHFFTSIQKTRKNWSRRNRRRYDLYLPAKGVREKRPFVIAMDCSGSVSTELAAKMKNAIDTMLNQSKTDLYVLQCDTQIFAYSWHRDKLPEEYYIYGRGGTKYAPVFDHIAQKRLNIGGLVYLTDGDSYALKDCVKPPYPVLWVVLTPKGYVNNSFKPEFGKVSSLQY